MLPEIRKSKLPIHEERVYSIRNNKEGIMLYNLGNSDDSKLIGIKVLLISQLVGVKVSPEVEVVESIVDVIKFHYRDFYEGEMQIAFEYNHAGKLQNVISHYGTFGLEYFCAVMNSYRIWRNKMLPKPVYKLEIKDYVRHYQMVYVCLDDFGKMCIKKKITDYANQRYLYFKKLGIMFIGNEKDTEELIKKANDKALMMLVKETEEDDDAISLIIQKVIDGNKTEDKEVIDKIDKKVKNILYFWMLMRYKSNNELLDHIKERLSTNGITIDIRIE